ncbi:GPP34 family phosphoprotein [Kribbella turkmenica]|uniref:GPP34 family phosphoprotein n=1 Tax=Kribbella turkmenica TaxID=2530375 RepID=A0A4R4WJJ9_9ACTN|nr:GPP34 family phosphoprotein [Kribbella turkmenica]TDD13820.1 GPP34 family phosphoprotein [Kribbella turkmenica]
MSSSSGSSHLTLVRGTRGTLPRRPAVSRRRMVALGRVKTPDSLAARLFLLAYDPQTGRLVGRWTKLGRILRAAALVDLQLRGNLADDNGRARLSKAAAPADPVLAEVLQDIRRVGPRKWRTWIDRRHGRIVRDVRDELERARLIKVEHYRAFGLFPTYRVTLRHPLVRRQLLRNATDALRPARLVTRIDLRDAAVLTLAATGDLRTVVTKEQRKRHKDRIAQLAVRVGPVVPALKKAIQASSHEAG